MVLIAQVQFLPVSLSKHAKNGYMTSLKDRTGFFGNDTVVAVGPRRKEHVITRSDHHVFTQDESDLLRIQIWRYFNFIFATFILSNIPATFSDSAPFSDLPKKGKAAITKYYNKKTFPMKWYDDFAPAFNKAMEFDGSSAHFVTTDPDFLRRISSILGLDKGGETVKFKSAYLDKKKENFSNWTTMTKTSLMDKLNGTNINHDGSPNIDFKNPYARAITVPVLPNVVHEAVPFDDLNDDINVEQAEIEPQDIIQGSRKLDQLASSFKPTFKQIVSGARIDAEQDASILEILENAQETATHAVTGVEILVTKMCRKITTGVLKQFHTHSLEETNHLEDHQFDVVLPYSGNAIQLIQCITSIMMNCNWVRKYHIIISLEMTDFERDDLDAALESIGEFLFQISAFNNLLNPPLHELPEISNYFLFWDPLIIVTRNMASGFFFTSVSTGSNQVIIPKV
jgi:hypothetical protein